MQYETQKACMTIGVALLVFAYIFWRLYQENK